jgi:DNA-binding response OmpR family regulator
MIEKPMILIVGSDRASLELMGQQFGQEGYDTVSAASLDELDRAILGKLPINVSLIDLAGFDERLWERCDELRKSKIPFIVISPRRSPIVQRDSMKHGASGLLVKPLGIKDLLEYVHTLLGDEL